MDFKNINKEWLSKWRSPKIDIGAFIEANAFSGQCIKDVGIEPMVCIKTLNMKRTCYDCWEYAWIAMWKRIAKYEL